MILPWIASVTGTAESLLAAVQAAWFLVNIYMIIGDAQTIEGMPMMKIPTHQSLLNVD